MVVDITPETIAIFVVFVVVLFILSRVLKILMQALLIAGIGFAFPWIVEYLGLGLPIVADVATGLQFAGLGVGIYLVYKFFNIVAAIFKLILLPFKVLFGKSNPQVELKRIKNELKRRR